ncbi:Uncharacterized protein OS=Acidobacterium capsulatum (strain ATCC 51196 / DSM 11244 / JCM 7670) GN=ACP_2094 PE=4 SV=1 [Gemmata massiliana]|uniref:Uncharacterized protein n=1 Tax=Gemmata massiliana TaxID=1210884 RepID=A0A6P2D3K7_9BACT|nr:hypothetical protein [Gemmata massiliana]VTR95729.1 Uncharacterized protein OS=Acidobacterium capsulatum (strain ATCC 51196 / DSM 11244 / JCM 7670) GN=ACP_2094 PE=4 SV=1 [Gemmata massiliana]
MKTGDATVEMQRRAREAVEMAATVYRETLDFTEPTVDAIDRILQSLWGGQDLSDDDRARVAWAFGSYLGEVARHHFPAARWERVHPVYDPAGPYIQLGDLQVFPVLWCYKHLHNGPPDSVALKYQAFRAAHLGRATVELNPGDKGRGKGRSRRERRGE